MNARCPKCYYYLTLDDFTGMRDDAREGKEGEMDRCAVCGGPLDGKEALISLRAGVATYKRLLDEQVDATNVVTKELNACYAELGIFRHPSEPDRGPDAIKRLREVEQRAGDGEGMSELLSDMDEYTGWLCHAEETRNKYRKRANAIIAWIKEGK